MTRVNLSIRLKSITSAYVFYNFDVISKNDFNYISCPSGKMYYYFASGIPIIGSNILGLAPIAKFNSGILINSHCNNDIHSGLENILENYEFYAGGSAFAATQSDFNLNASDYVRLIDLFAQNPHV